MIHVAFGLLLVIGSAWCIYNGTLFTKEMGENWLWLWLGICIATTPLLNRRDDAAHYEGQTKEKS